MVSVPRSRCFVLRTDSENGLINNLFSLVARLRELLPSYHLPRPELPKELLKLITGHPSPTPPASLPLLPNPTDPTRSTFLPENPPSLVTCFYCKKQGHMVKDCAKPECKASKPRKYGNNPTLQKRHNLRRNVNQVTHDKPNEPQVNSVVNSIQFALSEYTYVENIFSPGVMSSSTSSSDNNSYNITLNPFSSINHYNYLTPSSSSSSRSPTPSSSRRP
ncbi:hypothetical protein P9112_013909 [Eukaryota sp. TZLM1-RC]